MATNLALVSLTDNVNRLTADVKRIQKAYDSLKNKSTKYALDHQALLMAYKEVLAVYVRHLKAAQQSVNPTLLTEPVNYCNPVNGVHAPFCTGHKSQSG